MITFLVIFSALGVTLGLWREFTEQRRLKRMAQDCKERRHV
ncbi:hypothetical protein [uncultured Desulfovibrio sp.]|nr:hypothetical protein [uncultured Desulfovibrio sp.]